MFGAFSSGRKTDVSSTSSSLALGSGVAGCGTVAGWHPAKVIIIETANKKATVRFMRILLDIYWRTIKIKRYNKET